MTLDHSERRDHKALQDYRVVLGRRELLDYRACKGLRAPPDYKDLRGHLDHQGQPA